MAQALNQAILVGVVCATAACGSGPSRSFVAPVDPKVAVSGFMNAVRANNLQAMGDLWGTEDGPMTGRMDPVQLDMRLTVMQRYLAHESYTLLTAQAIATYREGYLSYVVELKRLGCVLRVPFRLVGVRGGWLVNEIDLTQAGNPGRRCVPR